MSVLQITMFVVNWMPFEGRQGNVVASPVTLIKTKVGQSELASIVAIGNPKPGLP